MVIWMWQLQRLVTRLKPVISASPEDGQTLVWSASAGRFVCAERNVGVTAAAMIDLLYPVGAVWMGVMETSPALLFGRGTWVAMAAGTPSGVNTGSTGGGHAQPTVPPPVVVKTWKRVA